MTESEAKNIMAYIRLLWPNIDWAREIQDEVYCRLLRDRNIELYTARRKLVNARIEIKFETIQPAEVFAAIAPRRPEPTPRTWAELHPDEDERHKQAAASMQRLRDRFTRATGKAARGPEFWDWITRGEPQKASG